MVIPACGTASVYTFADRNAHLQSITSWQLSDNINTVSSATFDLIKDIGFYLPFDILASDVSHSNFQSKYSRSALRRLWARVSSSVVWFERAEMTSVSLN